MDYAQLLGMTGGNAQSAGIMNTALGGENVGAQLLGATPAQLPGADFQGFNQTTPVADLLSKYRAEAAAAPVIPQYQPQMQAPAPAPVQAPAQAPVQPAGPPSANPAMQITAFPTQVNAMLNLAQQKQWERDQADAAMRQRFYGGTPYQSPNMASVLYPQGNWGVTGG